MTDELMTDDLMTDALIAGEASLMDDSVSPVSFRTITMCHFMLLETDSFNSFLEQAGMMSGNGRVESGV